QLVFGLSPFASGLITFSTAIGAMSAKFCAEWLIERFGFRANLVAATLITTLGVFAYAIFSPTTPTPLIIAILLVLGFAQSVFWTAISAFSFADIDAAAASKATVIVRVIAQTMFALGVAGGGGTLQTSELLRGGPA